MTTLFSRHQEIQQKLNRRTSTGWHAASFMIEVLVLLTIFAAAVCVFTLLFGGALAMSDRTATQVEAMSVAQRTAEEFAIDPAGIETEPTHTNTHENGDDLVVSIERTSETHERGTLWFATIVVCDDAGNELYSLDTTRYVAGSQTTSNDNSGESYTNNTNVDAEVGDEE